MDTVKAMDSNNDSEQELAKSLTFDELGIAVALESRLYAITQTLTIIACDLCSGTGKDAEGGSHECWRCSGTGKRIPKDVAHEILEIQMEMYGISNALGLRTTEHLAEVMISHGLENK